MSAPDWSTAIEIAEQMFGKNCHTLLTDGSVLLVKHNGSSLFLIQKKKENDYYSMHLRAGLMPNSAAHVASSFYVNMDFVLGENFEFTEDGSMLYGKEALQFAASNIHSLWNLDAIKTDVKPKYDGDLVKATRPKGTPLN